MGGLLDPALECPGIGVSRPRLSGSQGEAYRPGTEWPQGFVGDCPDPPSQGWGTRRPGRSGERLPDPAPALPDGG